MAWLAAHPALRASLLGVIATLITAIVILRPPEPVADLREWALGIVSVLRDAPASENVMVVDIDPSSIQQVGAWPWPRGKLADLISAIAAAGAKAVAVDIVLGGRCNETDANNRALADALGKAPVTLGFVLPGPDDAPAPKASIVVRQAVRVPELWRESGAEMPCPEFQRAAAGLSLLSLAGDSSASITTVSAIAAVGTTLYPGLAADAVRLASDASAIIMDGRQDVTATIGRARGHVNRSGAFRLHASNPHRWASRTITAGEVLAGHGSALRGKLVFVGSSLPQLGALRPTTAHPLTPSTQIHADIASALSSSRLPWRPAVAPVAEVVALILGTAIVLCAAIWLRPSASAAVAIAVILILLAAMALSYHLADLALDALLPSAGVAATGLVAGLSQYSAARTAETAIRRSFEQRLPPAVVARLTEAGAALKLESEERTVTALFTDIEGFTAMTSTAGSRELVRLLDGYFEGVTRIVTEAGGMVDKIVGDAAHAFFNMPLAQDAHEQRALDCAEAILAFTEHYRRKPDAQQAGFGRTRIGIETGIAMVGDVGAGGKIDYSAHGPSVNLAARLQDANKVTGTSILAGPGIRAAQPAGWAFDSKGVHDLRGFGPIEIFEPRRSG